MALDLGRQDGVGAPDATGHHEPPVARRHRFGIVLGGLAVVGVTAPLALLCFQIAVSPGHLPLYLNGDEALIALATKSAAGWHQLLGPYDRFGWHHPGPAYFYLQSLPAHALAPGQTTFFGQAAINGVAGLLAVATVWRRVGSRAALWSAIGLGYLGIVVGPELLRFAWNPYAVILPLCLLAVLCAGGATGSLLCLLGSLLVGSYLVQTDIGTAPVVAVLVALALIAHLLRRRSLAADDGPRVRPGTRVVVLAGLGGASLLAMWVGPLVQQIRDQPGNLSLLWDFFTSGHSHPGMSFALHGVGAVDSQLDLHGIELLTLHGSHGLALALALLVAVAAVACGIWRRQWFGFSLGLGSLVGQVVSVAAATRIVGPIYGYLLLWAIALPVVGAIGLGVALLGDDRGEAVHASGRWHFAAERPWTGVGVLLALGTVAVAAILGVKVAGLRPVSSLSSSEVGQAWTLVEPQLNRSDTSVLVDIRSHDSWPIAAGLTDQLYQRGIRATVPQAWTPVFGTGAATGRERVVVALYQREEIPPTAPSGSRQLGVAGDTVVYLSEQPANAP